MLIGFVLVNSGFSVVKAKLPFHAYSAEYKMPMQFWLALGLFGSGTYEENDWFVARCMLDYDYEGRVEFCNQAIKKNLTTFVEPIHVAKKIREKYAKYSEFAK